MCCKCEQDEPFMPIVEPADDMLVEIENGVVITWKELRERGERDVREDCT